MTMTITSAFCAGALLVLAAAADGHAAGAAKGPKYYFKIHEVDTKIHKDSSIEALARELLEKELGSRPEFTSDLGGAADDAAVIAELKKRGLRGFRVSLKLEKLEQAVKEPKPGGRLKQLALDQKLSVFGTTFPGEKLAFSGEGESAIVAEVVESRLAQEAQPLIKDGMAQALKQAVDQAVMKLSLPKSAPINESKRRKKK